MKSCEIAGMLRQNSTLNAIERVSDITQRQGCEAGFAVYAQKPVGFVVSGVLSGKSQPKSAHTVIAAMEKPYTSINLDTLVNDERAARRAFDKALRSGVDPANATDRDYYKKNVAMLLHSHPRKRGTFIDPVSYQLRPSIPDLDNYVNVEMANPELIESVLVLEDNFALASLVLYRRTDRSRPNMYHRYAEENVSRQRTIESMQDSGMSIATIQFDRQARQYNPGYEEELSKLDLKA